MKNSNSGKIFAATAAAIFASLAAMTARGAIVWDATESGRLMAADGETVVAAAPDFSKPVEVPAGGGFILAVRGPSSASQHFHGERDDWRHREDAQ